MKKLFLIFIPGLLLSGCGSSESFEDKEILEKVDKQASKISVSKEVLDEMIQTLPSPIETANLITKSKSSFKKDLLIPAGNAEKFSDKYGQALALGGYGVDMGYLNLNDKTIYIIEYLDAIRTVSKDLKVDAFFNFSLMSDLAKNRKNVDSLIHISTENFNKIDEHFRSQSRGDLSVLILVGSWVEGLYMFDKIALENKTQDIVNRIGEQKVIIDNMYAILNKIEHVEYYKQLKTKFDALKKVYDDVKISYVYHEPKMKEVNGELIVEDNTETIINITDEQLKAISIEINKLRNNLFLN